MKALVIIQRDDGTVVAYEQHSLVGLSVAPSDILYVGEVGYRGSYSSKPSLFDAVEDFCKVDEK